MAAKDAAVAKELVGGFGVPEHLIVAPIAKDWR